MYGEAPWRAGGRRGAAARCASSALAPMLVGELGDDGLLRRRARPAGSRSRSGARRSSPRRRRPRRDLVDELVELPELDAELEERLARSGARRSETLTTRLLPAGRAGWTRARPCRRGRRGSPRPGAPGRPASRASSRSSSAARDRGLDRVAPEVAADLLQLLLHEELRVLAHALGLRLGLAHDALALGLAGADERLARRLQLRPRASRACAWYFFARSSASCFIALRLFDLLGDRVAAGLQRRGDRLLARASSSRRPGCRS